MSGARGRVAVTTLGCKTNQFESAAMIEQLTRDGYELVPFEDVADIYVINTCTVTSRTDAESRRVIRRARRTNSAARIVVTGCFAQVAPGEVAGLPEVDLVIGNSEKKSLAEILREIDTRPRVIVSDISTESQAEALELETFAEHTRAFLQIQNGCDAFCSYCIVPYARGRSRSVPFERVLEGIRTFAGNGFREVVLTGIHLGGYGLDLSGTPSLAALVQEISRENLIPRLRIGSVDPLEITDELIQAIASSPSVCPHIHVPLQSGSDTVLARMGRGYTGAFYGDLVMRLAAAVPDIFIGADIIAGFPGETDGEFEETLRLVESLPLAHLHVFPFSARRGTPAAGMAGQVTPSVVKKRAEVLREVSAVKEADFARRFIGKTLPVLIQSRHDADRFRGLSRNYLQVLVSGGDCLSGTEIDAIICGYESGRLIGEPV